jgi:O-antigen/teichoic acid export membrane protein
MFLANVALARAQSKEEYGIFALTYSVFTFLAGLHNAAILETYTVYGSGRYNRRFSEYAWLLWRSNAWLGLVLTATISILWGVLYLVKPTLASSTVLGLALACGFLLTASFVRRTFYIRGRPDLAARFSFVFFATCAALLWFSIRIRILTGFYVFAIAAVAWMVAGVFLARELPGRVKDSTPFAEVEPSYWAEHWKYSRWVLATAFVFQFTSQGYYWLSAGILSVKETGDLRAMFNLVAPVDQLFIAMSLLILPMLAHRHASDQMAGMRRLLKSYGIGSLAVAGSFAVLVSLFGKPVMHVLYAGKFDDVAPLVSRLALLPVIMGLGNTANAALKAAERPNRVLLAYIASGLATFVVGIPLLMRLALPGAVYGLLVSAVVYTVTMWAGWLSITQSGLCGTLPSPRDSRSLISTVIFFLRKAGGPS